MIALRAPLRKYGGDYFGIVPGILRAVYEPPAVEPGEPSSPEVTITRARDTRRKRLRRKRENRRGRK